jgi:insulysin
LQLPSIQDDFHHTLPVAVSFIMESGEIRKPLIDDRHYSSIALPNGIVAVIISDPNTLVAAVAMSVGCGQMDDPPQVQGLAHFTEHMVFLGSGRPGCGGESAFTDFLATANGDHNAYTSLNSTTFHYSLSHTYTERSLEIFSGFFACPLLTQECALREMRAVDSENSKNIQNDTRREYQLMRSTGKPGALRFPMHTRSAA